MTLHHNEVMAVACIAQGLQRRGQIIRKDRLGRRAGEFQRVGNRLGLQRADPQAAVPSNQVGDRDWSGAHGGLNRRAISARADVFGDRPQPDGRRVFRQPARQVAAVMQDGEVGAQIGLDDINMKGWPAGEHLTGRHQQGARHIALARGSYPRVVEQAASQAGTAQVVVETLHGHGMQILFAGQLLHCQIRAHAVVRHPFLDVALRKPRLELLPHRIHLRGGDGFDRPRVAGQSDIDDLHAESLAQGQLVEYRVGHALRSPAHQADAQALELALHGRRPGVAQYLGPGAPVAEFAGNIAVGQAKFLERKGRLMDGDQRTPGLLGRDAPQDGRPIERLCRQGQDVIEREVAGHQQCGVDLLLAEELHQGRDVLLVLEQRRTHYQLDILQRRRRREALPQASRVLVPIFVRPGGDDDAQAWAQPGGWQAFRSHLSLPSASHGNRIASVV